MNNKLEVIGIDHGWSMMKTVTQVFVTGVKEITTTPALFGDVLEYDGKYYKIGTVRQEVKDTKVEDDSFYLLTLAAVAKELKKRGLSDAKVFLAVGLPLTRFGAERNNFIKYLTKNKRVDFRYENEAYHIEIDDVAVFPQCYAAVVDKIPTMAKKTLVVDIGSWTIDIMPVINKSPDESKCVTVPRGLITCMRSINEQCVRQLNGEVDETEIQNIMRYGRSDIDDEYLAIIKAEIEDFVEKVYNSIREFGYNLKTTPIVVLFFVIGFCSESIDVKDEMRFESILRMLIRLGLAEWFVANNVTIMKAFFTSIGNLVGLISEGTTTQLAIDSAQADIIKELGFGESLVMLILTALLAIIIIICGFFIIYTVYFRFLKILIIVPLGAIACSTMAGNRMVSHTMSTYCKYFLSCVFEAVTMALAIVVCNAFINAGLPSFTGSYADWAQTLIYLCEMTFTIAMTVGSVKGAQTLTSKAFGL